MTRVSVRVRGAMRYAARTVDHIIDVRRLERLHDAASSWRSLLCAAGRVELEVSSSGLGSPSSNLAASFLDASSALTSANGAPAARPSCCSSAAAALPERPSRSCPAHAASRSAAAAATGRPHVSYKLVPPTIGNEFAAALAAAAGGGKACSGGMRSSSSVGASRRHSAVAAAARLSCAAALKLGERERAAAGRIGGVLIESGRSDRRTCVERWDGEH